MRNWVRCGVSGAAMAAVLTACGSQPAAEPAAPAVSEAADTASTPDQLRDALLPASAFGPDATVVGVTLDQLGSSLPMIGGIPEGTTIAPPLCAAAGQMLPGTPDELPALVARAALTDTVRTLEVLADGPELEELQLPVDQLLAACSTVTVTGADGAVTTVQLAELDVPDLGSASTGLQVTVTSAQGTLAALVGVVSEGSRAVLLVQAGAGGALPDAAGFSELLGEAAGAAW